MTGIEAIPKISELLHLLIQRAKDRQTAALVQQIQQHQLVIHAALVEAEAKIRDLERRLDEEKAEEIRIHRMIEFRRGKRTAAKWVAFCPKCHLPAAPLSDEVFGKTFGAICSGKCGWKVLLPKQLKEVREELGN